MVEIDYNIIVYVMIKPPLLNNLIILYNITNLILHPPPPRTAEGRFIVFVPKKMSSRESLDISELFRFKDPKTWFFSIFTQTKF